MSGVAEVLCSRLWSRAAVLVLIGAGVAACSADTSRFNDNPFASISRPDASMQQAQIAPAPQQKTVLASAAPKEPEPVQTAAVVAPADPLEKEATKLAEGNGTVPKFRWPANGRVIAGYGATPNGQQNDGINISLPENTPVKAAEEGVVAYAGNELKGYGNLVLVRHPNGYVTAYEIGRASCRERV